MLKTARAAPGPTEARSAQRANNASFSWPLALPSRESFTPQCPPKQRPPRVLNSIYCTFLLACMCDCAVRRLLHLPVQVPRSVHIPFFPKDVFPGAAANPHACHSPSTVESNSTRPALTGVRENVRCINDSIISFLFPRRHSLQPSSRSFTPYKYRPAVFVAILLITTLSLRLTTVACDSHSSVNPSIPA